MQRILVVDDERDFRDQLCLCLEENGREVCGAADCREAIEQAGRVPPDVLVTDWMLRDHRHGLHVSETLAAVNPGLRTVLMTGYACADIRVAAQDHHVAAIIEKPFAPERLSEAVREAAGAEAPLASHPDVGVFRVESDGSLAWANPVAQELLGPDPARAVEDLERAPAEWTAVSADRQVRGRACADGGMLVIVLEGDELRDHSVVQSLAGTPARAAWNLPGHVLLVGGDGNARRSVADELRRAGCPCLTAESGDVALRHFRRNQRVFHVLLDCAGAGELARRLREIRPAARVVEGRGLLAEPATFEAVLASLRAAPPTGPREDSPWSLRLHDLRDEFGTYMSGRPGARATRATTVMEVLCGAWPRAMSVQEIVEALWAEPGTRARRAAGSVRNALRTVSRNLDGFNEAVATPLFGLRCALWRSAPHEAKLCRYALRVERVEKGVEASADVRAYLASLPEPVLEALHAAATGAADRMTPEAEQACRDVGRDVDEPSFRDAVIQAVERRR